MKIIKRYAILSQKKMKKIFLTLLLLIVNCSLNAQTQELTLENIFLKPKFFSAGIGTFLHLSDGEHYAKRDSTGSLIIYDYKTGTVERKIFDIDKFCSITGLTKSSIDNFITGKINKRLLITTESEMVYRRSFIANYYIYDITTASVIDLSQNKKFQYAEFSPDENKVLYVYENNIYVYDIVNNKHQQITNDGKRNFIINGLPDWVYEEEFGVSKAFEWSPDNKKIAFLKFDESRVKEYEFPIYGQTYPELFKYKYPKAGEDNSKVSLWIYDFTTSKVTNIDFKDSMEYYIPRIKWTSDNNLLSVVRVNRLQNQLLVHIINTTNFNITTIINYYSSYYIDELYDLYFLKDNSFIRLSEESGFTHIYHYNINGSLIRQITDGNWEVKELKGVDEENNTLYFISNEPSPLDKALYSIKLDGTDKHLLSPANGTSRAQFSKNYQYYILNYSDANTPPLITLNSVREGVITILQDNKKLKSYIEQYNFIQKKFISFINSVGVKINGWIMMPELEPGKKYPVLFEIYSGPGSQMVLNSWGGTDYIWYQYLCKKGYIIVCFDGRGTGGRGTEFKKANYKRLGSTEIDDQIEAVKYLYTLPYIDTNRIGIWGWSYGGYATLMCMLKGSEYFKTGIAVAPVTDWRFYDNIYTERFMQRPVDNPEGYEQGSVLNYVDQLKGNLLLIHGSADDNVHFQNTMELTSKLVDANKQFEMQIYPNKNHGIYGGVTTYHLFKRITEFLFKNL